MSHVVRPVAKHHKYAQTYSADLDDDGYTLVALLTPFPLSEVVEASGRYAWIVPAC